MLTLPPGSGREELAEHLGKIIDYVGAVGEIGGGGDGATEDEPVRLRPDTAAAAGGPAWLGQAPRVEGPFVRVPGLFGNE